MPTNILMSNLPSEGHGVRSASIRHTLTLIFCSRVSHRKPVSAQCPADGVFAVCV